MSALNAAAPVYRRAFGVASVGTRVTDRSGGYRPQLDSLRAIAVSLVLLMHFWLPASIIGSIGVRVFFVLSGFLITDILIAMRGGDGAFQTRPAAWLNFFIRRALRLWPVYFVLLGGALLLDLDGLRETAAWHILYASNILYVLHQRFDPWVVGHWWTLSIEQQFYLIWPFFVLLPPRRALKWIMIATVFATALWMYGIDRVSDNEWVGSLLLPGSMDALAAGGLLSLALRDRAHVPQWLWILTALALPGIIGLLAIGAMDWPLSMISLPPMMLAVALAHVGVRGPLGRLLEARPVVAIGRVSYGIYLYHMFVLYGLLKLGMVMPLLAGPGPLMFLVGAPLTVGIAFVSWRLIEAPANRLKRHFPYSPQGVTP